MRFKLAAKKTISIFFILFLFLFSNNIVANEENNWHGDINPIEETDWNISKAKHLLERAGFGGSPKEVELLFTLGVNKAVEHLVYYENISVSHMSKFDESDIHDPGLINFLP